MGATVRSRFIFLTHLQSLAPLVVVTVIKGLDVEEN